MKNYSKILTKEFLYQGYIAKQKSHRQIAQENALGSTTVLRYLKKYNIKTRTNSEAKLLKFKIFEILTKDFLYTEYITNKKSSVQIAKETGYNSKIILEYLYRYNIPIRTKSEARKDKFYGKNNPNWKGITSKSYHCKQCGNLIWLQTALYGGGLCGICSKEGKNNPNWKDGLSLNPYPTEWVESLKEAIRQRDNRQCQICGKLEKDCYRKLDVHHIDYDKENLDPKNLISLCQSCHIATNYSRETYIEFFKILKEIRYV